MSLCWVWPFRRAYFAGCTGDEAPGLSESGALDSVMEQQPPASCSSHCPHAWPAHQWAESAVREKLFLLWLQQKVISPSAGEILSVLLWVRRWRGRLALLACQIQCHNEKGILGPDHDEKLSLGSFSG